jgi:hypothetical protein
MSLLLIAALCLVALQFTSAIGQWISENQQATQTVTWLQGLVSKIGLAPTIITTRVIIIAAFVVAYELQVHFLAYAIFAAAVWYLYKTGKYITVWAQLKKEAVTVVEGDAASIVGNLITDAEKTLVVNTQANAASSAAAAGVDVSKLSGQ